MNDIQQKTYIFSIAISDYHYFDKLPNAIQDSNAIRTALEDKYKIEKVWQLLDHDVSSSAIKGKFKEIKETVSSEDALLIIYNGHGSIKGNNNIAYWQFVNSQIDTEETWYKCSDFFDELTELDEIKHIAVLVNSCFSGDIFFQDGLNSDRYDSGEGRKSRTLLTASLRNQTTRESHLQSLNSPFSSALISVLSENEKQYKLSLLTIITYIYFKFEENDFGSNPRYGSFKGNEGGLFTLQLKEDADTIWIKTLENDTIENYDRFIRKFPSSKHVETANEKKQELIDNGKHWADALDRIIEMVQPFTKEEYTLEIINQSSFVLKKIQDLAQDLDKSEEDNKAWDECMSINNSDVPDQKKVQVLEKFKSNYQSSQFYNLATDMLDSLKRNITDEKLWRDICRKKNRTPTNVKRGFIEYIHSYRYDGNHFTEATKKYSDVSLYMEARMMIDDQLDLDKGRKLLKKYQNKFPEGLYKNSVKRELNKVSIEAQVKKITSELEEAKSPLDLAVLYDLINQIEGFSKDEKTASIDILSEAQQIVSEYEYERDEDHKTVKQSDSIPELKSFIVKYSDDEFAEELVTDIQNRFYDKEEELFDEAKRKKDVKLFYNYMNTFEATDTYYDRASQRIKELEYYEKLQTKEQFKKYLTDYEEKGLMLEEAQTQIASIEYKETKQQLYEQALTNDSIDICQNYLDDYDNNRDKKWSEIEVRFKKLDYDQKATELFKEIEQATETKAKLNLCKSYLLKYSEGLQQQQVTDIAADIQGILNSRIALQAAIEKKSIEAFNNYKDNHPHQHDEANDYIDYLEAKKLKTKEAFQKYIEAHQETGLNISEAKDGMRFLEALETEVIDDLHEYNQLATTTEFEAEANSKIKELAFLAELDAAFQKANETDDIKVLSKYIRSYGDKNEGYRDKILDKLGELKREKRDHEEFEIAKNSKNTKLLTDYIGKYGNKGLHINEATKLVQQRNLGITEKDINVLQKMDANAAAIRSLSDNTKTTNDHIQSLMKQLSESQQKNEEDKKLFRKKLLYSGVGVITAIVIVLIVVYVS